ncbi:Fe-S cluster assembly protein NifU [Oscillatoria sp. FACHB-1406]|uniref:Fe-S cluster assembly protein NifU n=1 Tax=Oscillatoria sp. FACHB-1406 TaxID=2692846 RepID=UPI0016884136|nr:Fe-S cluster assembly protein NifU [Oscillatoria sp. FACHB-1406]MBD2577785.1 Fe-S cluster assembly protein NifU [Oscillatoria sp. FACHB-1406]
MWDYTEKVMEHFHHPRNQGAIAECETGEKIVTGEVGSIACGDALRLHLKIDEATQTIKDARFQTFGCASAIASSSALTELLKGKNLEDAARLTNREIADFLGGLPEEKMHCSVMGQEALEAAIHTYKGIPLYNHDEDEGNLICSCFGITDTKIKRIIVDNNLTEAEQVTNYVKAGGGCGTCLTSIDDILAEVALEKQQDIELATELRAIKSPAYTVIPQLTNLQKISRIQQVLEQEVRPILMEDGGDVELFDVEGDTVKVLLKGACVGCSSSSATLEIAIQATLRDRVLPSLVVEAV